MAKIVIFILKAYKYLLSPFFPPACRYLPTCSAYAADAVRRYGTLKGGYLAVKRLLRCHPFHPGGYDPVK
ncbi:MAG: membrane protein insertion efficiency factor YidD [Nitrospirae bacterium]|nr:membrane protein insertion efficiency factor YidD [Nitrospirota bacterium]